MVSRFLISALVIVLVGCSSIGDSVVIFDGRIAIQGSENYMCRLSLFQGDQKVAVQEISDEFLVDITVDTSKKEYLAEISCAGGDGEDFLLERKTLVLEGPSSRIHLGTLSIPH